MSAVYETDADGNTYREHNGILYTFDGEASRRDKIAFTKYIKTGMTGVLPNGWEIGAWDPETGNTSDTSTPPLVREQTRPNVPKIIHPRDFIDTRTRTHRTSRNSSW